MADMRKQLLALARRVGASPVRRVAAVVVAAMVGGWLGLLLGGYATVDVGPVEARFSLRPSLSGNTVVHIAPLGSVTFDTHDGPLRLDASVDQIRPKAAEHILDDPTSLNGVGDHLVHDLRGGVTRLFVKSAASALIGAALFALVVFRRPRIAGWSTGVCAAFLAVTGLVSFLTFNPRSITEPRYTGLLTSAPSVVGTAESIVQRFTEYREELARLVTNVSRLYDTTSTLPVYQPDPSTIRVLHVSDIHLNPAAWSVMHSVTKQFRVQVIVDSGDLTDRGSAAEAEFAGEISSFNVPYVWVRGNHDSKRIERAVARQKNAVVLNGTTKKVAGLRFFGAGDPRFTPDRLTREHPDSEAVTAVGLQLAERLRTADPPVDVAVIHDPAESRTLDGTVPLVLSGHLHKRVEQVLPRGTQLMVEGSTGGAGLRALDHEKPTPIECSVLYIDRTTHRLQAWDDITLGGLGLTSAHIERHVASDPDRALESPMDRSPAPTPSTSVAR